MAVDLLLTPRWFRWTDFGLSALRTASVTCLGARLASPLLSGEPVQQATLDAALLLGPVVLGSLLRSLLLWPRAFAHTEVPAGPLTRVGWWPAPVLRAGALEVCPAARDALPALGVESWWGRYRVLSVEHRLQGALRRALGSALVVMALTAPVFLLLQSIEYGSPLGQWAASGPAAWLRTLVKTGLSVSISAVVWWGVLGTAVHLVWALWCLGAGPSARAASGARWAARLAWVAAPLALLLRQLF